VFLVAEELWPATAGQKASRSQRPRIFVALHKVIDQPFWQVKCQPIPANARQKAASTARWVFAGWRYRGRKIAYENIRHLRSDDHAIAMESHLTAATVAVTAYSLPGNRVPCGRRQSLLTLLIVRLICANVAVGSWPGQNALPQKPGKRTGLRCELLFPALTMLGLRPSAADCP
jgi:hypothetical protein